MAISRKGAKRRVSGIEERDIYSYEKHAFQALIEAGEKPRKCPKCGRPTFNRLVCNGCRREMFDYGGVPSDVCGIEIGAAFI
jgi:hypothetical protein